MFWVRLRALLPVPIVAFVLSLVPAISAALKDRIPPSTKGRFTRFRLRVLTGLLHLMQPLTRLWSRLVYSIIAGNVRGFLTISFPWPRMFELWSEALID